LATAALGVLTTDQIQALGTGQIQALSTAGVAVLTTDQAVALTTDQIVALTTAQFAVLSTDDVPVLSTDQIVAIETADVAALKTAQISVLTTDQVVALTTDQIRALSTAAVVALTTDQIRAIETRDIAALTTRQIVAIETRDIAALTTDQVQALTSAQLAALTSAQQAALPLVPLNIPSLTTAQIAALTVAQIVGLTTDQIVSLSTAQAAAISTAGVAALTSDELIAFETEDLAALTNAQISALTSAQTVIFSTTQVESFTSNQISAFTIPAYQQLDTSGTPIIFDLNGDGVRTLGISAGVKFDLFADGTAINTGWVSGGDGLLVMDRNHDGAINDGSELFGSSTRLTNGEKAKDGYAALRELDENGDGYITSEDTAYADLRVWVDSNSDGLSSAGEVRTLESLGVSKISVNAKVGTAIDNGNILGLISNYETTDGVSHDAADVWFRVDKVPVSSESVDKAISALGAGVGSAGSADTAYVPPPSVPFVLPQVQVVPTAPLVTLDGDGLRSKVSGMVQAIGSFADAPTYPTSGMPQLEAPSASGALVTRTVLSMVDVMKQFDANGNPIGNLMPPLAAAAQSLTEGRLQNTNTNGFLAAEV
jgi:hypothetical protein